MLPLSLAVIAAAAPPPTDSPAWARADVRAALRNATEKLWRCRTGYGHREEHVENVTAALDKLLDAVGEKEAAKIATSEHVWPAKLVALALDRRKHPKRYAELVDTYGGCTLPPPPEGDLVPRGGGSFITDRAELLENHVADEYRLAWEFRLLVHRRLEGERSGRNGEREWGFATVKWVGGFQGRKFTYTHACRFVSPEAVYRIGDERSITTALAACRMQRGGYLLSDDEGLDLFEILARHQSEAGVRALLAWAEETELAQVEHCAQPNSGKVSDLKLIPRDLIAGLAARGRPGLVKLDADGWRRLAEKVPEAGLSVREKELRAILIAGGTK